MKLEAESVHGTVPTWNVGDEFALWVNARVVAAREDRVDVTRFGAPHEQTLGGEITVTLALTVVEAQAKT